jgi:hypothetical protein
MRRPRTTLPLLLALVALASAAPSLPGGESVATSSTIPLHPAPLFARRIVQQFDFEERQHGNFESMPRNWRRVAAPGFPAYTEAAFDDQLAHAGQYSLKLQLNGGSCAVALDAGVIPAIPDAHYLLSAAVRTHKAQFSRARLVAYFIDQVGRVIDGTRRTSSPVVSNDAWTAVELDMPDAPQNGAWIILRMELLQPEQFQVTHLGPHELSNLDIDSAAWFDDLTLSQLPRIELRSSDTGVVRQPQRPKLSARVHDLSGAQLKAVLTVMDRDGKVVATQERLLDPQHPGTWEWEPPLPELGWYWAELRIQSPAGIAGRAAAAMVWLPPMPTRAPAEADRFLVLADDLSQAQRRVLPEAMEPLGQQAVSVALWRAEMTKAELLASSDEPDPVLDRMLRQDRSIILSLPQVPQELALEAQTDTDRPLDLFAKDSKVWAPHLQALLARYGHHVRSWQIGQPGGGEAFWRPDLAAVYANMRGFFDRYVSEPRVALPWNAEQAVTPAAAAVSALIMRIPVGIQPGSINDYAKTWPHDHTEITCELQTLDARFSSSDRATDLALRMVQAWQSDPRRIAIRHPWAHRVSAEAGAVPMTVPDPLLPVWVNVAEQLAGRRIVGRMNLGAGLACYLLDGPGGGVLVAWNVSSTQGDAELDLYLGTQPVAVDIYGNRTPLQRTDQKQRLTLGPAPLFIEGVDMRLARFRSTFALDPEIAISSHAVHQHNLKLTNPWPRTLTGRLRLTGPGKWDFQPRITNFSIPAGGALDIPLAITFPVNETAGTHLVTAHLNLDADHAYEMDLAAPLTLGLPNLQFQSTVARDTADGSSTGQDLVVTVVATNLGDEDQSFYVFAVAPDEPAQQRIISPLKGHQTVVKKFRFPASASRLAGQQLRVGLRQTDGPAVLNHLLDVP